MIEEAAASAGVLATDWQRHVENRLQTLELRNAVDEVHRVNVEKRLSAIEDTLKWLVRLMIGALIMAGITYALKGGFAQV